jgi:hypothetical protein
VSATSSEQADSASDSCSSAVAPHSIKVNKGEAKPEDFDNYGLPTIKNTIVTTAIIRAGRISLDEKRSVVINVDSNGEYSLQ